MEDFRHLEIQLEVVKAATNNFTDKPIGRGGFGAVYKGELPFPTGPRTVAFKRLDRNHGQGDVEFWKEILMLSDLQHEHITPLLHFCREGNERILAYEYASGGSLDKHLDDPRLTYMDRLKISVGAAKGIAYLHNPKINAQQQRVLHRDIKSSNILLYNKGTAKVSDLGLSKYGPANQARTFVVSNVVGTPGYVDPEYLETGILSKESDVYSFGVVLVEVICGILCYKYDKDGGLLNAWKKCCDEDRLDDIIFPDLMKQQLDQESLWTYVSIAKRCLNRNRKERPTMAEVVKELEFALHLQLNSEHDNADPTKMSKSYRFMELYSHHRIGLKDVSLTTNNCSNDNVYWDNDPFELPSNDRVFLKRFHRSSRQENEEFWNLVSLLDEDEHYSLKFCCEGDAMIVVLKLRSSDPNYVSDMYGDSISYPYQDSFLGNFSQVLPWRQQMQEKIEVLREHVETKNLPQTFPTSVVDLSEKFDVHSFGVGLFRIVSNRLPKVPTDSVYEVLDPSSFMREWNSVYDTKRLEEINFPALKDQIDSSSLNVFLSIAYRCVNEDPKERPTPAEILKELEKALKLQVAFEEKLKNKNPFEEKLKNKNPFEEKLKNKNPEISNNSRFQNSWPLFKGVHMLETASITC